jgi:OmpR family response regulator RpaB
LTTIEFNLLQLLLANKGKGLARTTILDNIWGYTPERYTDTRVVDVYISRLRSKIEKDSGNPDLILTVRGVGYTFYNY